MGGDGRSACPQNAQYGAVSAFARLHFAQSMESLSSGVAAPKHSGFRLYDTIGRKAWRILPESRRAITAVGVGRLKPYR